MKWNIAKYLRTPIFKKICERLLLKQNIFPYSLQIGNMCTYFFESFGCLYSRIVHNSSLNRISAPILTELVSIPNSMQFSSEILWVVKTSWILENIPSTVDEEDVHMSRNWLHTYPRLISKILTVRGFIFSTSESLEPSIAIEKRSYFTSPTSSCLKKGATASLMVQAVFVLRDEQLLAILLSEKMLRKSGVSLSATDLYIYLFS